MKSRITIVFVFLLISFLLEGCTIHHQARLYDLETGNVILVNARIRGDRAINEAVLQTGEKCNGESISGGEGFRSFGWAYSSVNLFSSWGNIYGYGSTTYSSAAIPLSQRGVSVLICENGITFECEYRVMSDAVQGHGICKDNRGKYYRLMF
jgi:hypothetical protein